MANSYNRRCRTCRRPISMRKMPHGQWVAFENDEPHRCKVVPAPSPRTAPKQPTDTPTEFPDIEIPEEAVSPSPRPHPQPPPREQPSELLPDPPGKPQRPVHRPDDVILRTARPDPDRVPYVPIEPSPVPRKRGLSGFFSAAVTLLTTGYVCIGALHSVAFTLLVSRTTCLTTAKTLVSIFCNTGMGVAHFVVVLGWPWYWF